MYEPEAICVFTGLRSQAVRPLLDFVRLRWSGADRLGCLETIGDGLAAAVEYAAERAFSLPDCLHVWASEAEHVITRDGFRSADERLLSRLSKRLGERRGVSEFRRLCGCETCAALREADGWAGMLHPEPGRLASWHDDLSPAERPPVVLADVSMPLLAFVASLNPEQRVLTADGVVMPASDFVREVRVISRDKFGRALVVNGRPVERKAVAGRAVEGMRSETAYPGIGPLAAAAVPERPRTDHDWQSCRHAARLAGRGDLLGDECPHGVGPDNAGRWPEGCAVCGAVGPYPPGLHGKARPLVVLCHDCDADIRSALEKPDGWRYIVQPDHGLQSLIGRTRMSSAVGRDGEEVFDLSSVKPGYVPFVLSILPPHLLAHDRYGQILAVAEWIERIFDARKP